MASSSEKRSRSDDNENQEEETHLKKHKLDLNKEPESEEENLNEEEIDMNEDPQVIEEANQNEEHNHDKEREEQDEIVKAAFALSHMMLVRDLTRDRNQNQIVKTEEEDEQDNEETNLEKQETEHQEKPLDSVLWLKEKERKRWIQRKEYEAEKEEFIKRKKIEVKCIDEDDSDATLGFLLRWKIPATPPEKIVNSNMIEKCSKPIRKQVTKKDQEQSRLGLSKSQVAKKFLPLLDETEIPKGKDGIRVSVYGPDGKIRVMKMWPNEKEERNELDLTFGWREFVEDYELKEICDFITVWMFRHILSHEICLAIDTTRFVLRKKVSKRISKAAFDDSE